jgi:hypothetical protein
LSAIVPSTMPTVTFVFSGHFELASFADFARHRVARLALDAGPPDLQPDRVRITVSGQDDLVDAFEVACSLGPIDCLVADVVRYPGDPPSAGGVR